MAQQEEFIASVITALQSGGRIMITRAIRGDNALPDLYALLPVRFPRLFEHMAVWYSWPETELRQLRLLANSAGNDLSGLTGEIFKDEAIVSALLVEGFVQFGRSFDGGYDPVCFDTRRRRHGGDCPVVQIDHEAILCRSRVQIVSEIASSFRDLCLKIISTSNRT